MRLYEFVFFSRNKTQFSQKIIIFNYPILQNTVIITKQKLYQYNFLNYFLFLSSANVKMGQVECCQNAYHDDKDLTLKFHNLHTNQPIQSSQGKLLVSAVTSDRNVRLTHGPSINEGTFVQKIPQLKYQVRSRLEELHQYRMSGSQIVDRGQQEHGYFCFKKTGIIYRGQWRNGKPNGWGKNFYPNGGYYEGSFIDGIPHGSGRFIMENGDFYEGQIRFGRANGNGYFQTNNGQYRGSFKDNVRHGYGQQRTQQLFFQGVFQYGDRKEGIMKYNDGDIYEGQFEQNLYDGKGSLTSSQGIYTGHFRNGLQNGYGEFKWKDGSFYRGNYHNGQRQGDGQFYNSKNHSISRGFWKKGILQGQGEYVESTGKVYKCIWSQGKLKGLRT